MEYTTFILNKDNAEFAISELSDISVTSDVDVDKYSYLIKGKLDLTTVTVNRLIELLELGMTFKIKRDNKIYKLELIEIS